MIATISSTKRGLSIPNRINLIFEYDNLLDCFNSKEIIENSKHIFVHDVNINKFYNKVIEELLKYVSVGNRVEFEIKDNSHLTHYGLKQIIKYIWKNDFKYISQYSKDNNFYILYERVTMSSKPWLYDIHNGWTIGILTNGRNLNQMVSSFSKYAKEFIIVSDEKISISSDKIKNIVWGKDDLGEITKKKNRIIQESSCNDILLLHDRFLNLDFFEKFNHYSYSIIQPRIQFKKNRGLCWAIKSNDNLTHGRGGFISFRDYSKFLYVSGGSMGIRKSFGLKYPFDESLYWNEHEDVELSRRVIKNDELLYLAKGSLEAIEDRWFDQNPLLPFNENSELTF